MSLPSWPSSAGQTLIASAGGLDFHSLAEQYGKLTVREITSGSSGLAFAQLVAARAAMRIRQKRFGRNNWLHWLTPESFAESRWSRLEVARHIVSVMPLNESKSLPAGCCS